MHSVISKSVFRSTCALALAVAGTSLASGQIVAAFNGGAGTASSDQFAGAAGNGWSAGWTTDNQSDSSTTASIQNSSPLLGGGNYLQVVRTITNVGATSQRRGGISRNFEASVPQGVSDLTADLTYSFDFRIDSAVGWDQSTADILYIHSTVGSSGITAGNNNSTAWSFQFRGSDSAILFNNGTAVVDTTKDFTVGNVYSFSITSSLASETWSAEIFENGVAFHTIATANWRAIDALTPLASNPGNITFSAGVNRDVLGNGVTFSVDNIAIATAIPEPSSSALVGGLAMLLAMVRRRR